MRFTCAHKRGSGDEICVEVSWDNNKNDDNNNNKIDHKTVFTRETHERFLALAGTIVASVTLGACAAVSVNPSVQGRTPRTVGSKKTLHAVEEKLHLHILL